MSNKTMMTEFKRNLENFRGFSEDQKTAPHSQDIIESISKLLDDEKMMSENNHFNFEQRTNSTIIILFRSLVNLSFSEYEEDREKAKELNAMIANAPIQIESGQVSQ